MFYFLSVLFLINKEDNKIQRLRFVIYTVAVGQLAP